MAKFYPSSPSGNTPSSEVRVWRSLEALPDPWRVFHSVVWQSRRGGREGDGEVDFLLLHPSVGLIVLEVKGGSLTVVDNQWFSTDRSNIKHEIKNPFNQAKDSKYALIKYLDSVRPSLTKVPVCHAVAFPNASIDSAVGTYGPRPIIIDSTDLLNIERAIARIHLHWDQKASLSKEHCAAITNLLAPTTTIRTRLRGRVAESNAALIELTERQKEVFRQLRLVRRAVVKGTAGTGKTVLAIERARLLADEGAGVLLTCFNAPLAERIAADLQDRPTVQVSTFHALSTQQARKAGLGVPNEPSESWWEADAPNSLTQAAEANGLSFDAIIIDEAQDFAASWFDSLLLLLNDPDNGPAYVFADTQQAIYRPGWSLDVDWTPLPLDVNCRNTLPIAQKVAAVFGDQVNSRGADGEKPVWSTVDDSDMVDEIQSIVDRLISVEQLLPEQITVLSDSRPMVERLRTLTVSDASFVAPGKHGVVAETIHRFKGLESDVVVLALTGDESHDTLPLAYVGMSRARSLLVVVGSKDLRKLLSW